MATPAPTASEPTATGNVKQAAASPAAPKSSSETGTAPASVGSPVGFLRLRSERYTVQLARGDNPAGFSALVAGLGIAPGEAYALPLNQNGARTWLLVWGEFGDEASAQTAAARLPGRDTLHGVWPRRIRAIQDELRLAGAAAEHP
jgi:septal ring-binding cell division protein DamX